ncbi:MAG: NAD(P)-dependent alcohol dehydrogenase [Bacteroidota bacterium]
MKAFVQTSYGPTSGLQLHDVPEPPLPAAAVRIRVDAIGLNPADWHLLKGDPLLVRLQYGFLRPRYPVMGIDLAGEVVDVGPEALGFTPGDRVVACPFDSGLGAFAEYVHVPAAEVVKLPDGVSVTQAAALPVAGLTAYHALVKQYSVQPGQSVLINGASGGVGTFAVQIAKTRGAEVTAVCSTRNVELVRSLGADHVVDYRTTNFLELDRRFDLIMDNVCNHPLSRIRRRLKPGGTVLAVGYYTARRLLRQMLLAPLISAFRGQRAVILDWKYRVEDLRALVGMVTAGEVRSVIDRTLPFSDLREGLAYLEAGHARGKVVVRGYAASGESALREGAVGEE